jgi:hypothetical protein
MGFGVKTDPATGRKLLGRQKIFELLEAGIIFMQVADKHVCKGLFGHDLPLEIVDKLYS